MERAPEHDMQGGSVNDEHAEARAAQDAGEVVQVSNDGLAEGEAELGLDSVNLYRGNGESIVRSQTCWGASH